jgi:hypothetical protein
MTKKLSRTPTLIVREAFLGNAIIDAAKLRIIAMNVCRESDREIEVIYCNVSVALDVRPQQADPQRDPIACEPNTATQGYPWTAHKVPLSLRNKCVEARAASRLTRYW